MYNMKLIERLMQNTEYLTKEEELELFKKYWNKQISKEKLGDALIRANIKFIVSVARQYINTTKLSLNDLVSEGITGYCEAIGLYDDEAIKFNSYAVFWVKARISEHLEKHSFAYKVPHNIAQDIRQEIRLEKEYQKRKMTAEKAGIEFTEKEFVFNASLKKTMQELKSCFSLDTKINTNETTTYAEIIECQKSALEITSCEDENLKEYIQDKIGCLNSIEQVVVRVWFNFYEDNITFKELAERSGIKYNQLSTIRDNAIQKLKFLIKKEHV